MKGLKIDVHSTELYAVRLYRPALRAGLYKRRAYSSVERTSICYSVFGDILRRRERTKKAYICLVYTGVQRTSIVDPRTSTCSEYIQTAKDVTVSASLVPDAAAALTLHFFTKLESGGRERE